MEEITEADVEEARQEAINEVNNIGELDDNLPKMPTQEQLEQLKKMIDSLPPDKAAELLANLASTNGNLLNPNNRSYSTKTEQEILKEKFKRKMQQKKYGRMTKSSRETEKKKYTESLQKKQQQKQQQQNKEQPNN